ncbi:MAG TPA: hypothetical protein PKD19_03405 [Candidatus Saccharibacteria bacterium]|nr:hypothetical protein [Candidatus Saccharibacteria bacterium]
MTNNRKPIHCPECGSSSVARVMKGMPAFDDELERDIEEGRIILGGCEIVDGAPHLVCNDCKHQWRWDGKRVENPIDTDDSWLHEVDEAINDK